MPRFLFLYAAMYAAFGVASPFLPAFVSERGLPAEQLGLVLGAGTAVRLLSSPLAGRVGDLLGALRLVLFACAAIAAFVTLGYLPAEGFWLFLAVALLHAAALAPITVLADALALAAASRRGFEYGWIRGAGSAAFIAGTLVSGQAVGGYGLQAIVWMQAALLAVAAVAALAVPEVPHERKTPQKRHFAELLRIPRFVLIVAAAALILGSHAMHDTFAVIQWRAAGIGPSATSLLWSESVAAEVLVFFLIGPPLIARITPAGAVALAALAGAVRWAAMAQSSDIWTLALVQPLHGITFALLHLACMRMLARTVPPGLEGTAQALYGTVGVGAATAALTFAAGGLYAGMGPQAFWAMAALCLLALPLAWSLRERAP